MNNSPHLSQCPTPETLAEFLLGNYENSDRESIEAHFRTCDQCVHLAAQLAPEDSISLLCRDAAGIEAPFAQTLEEDFALTRIIERSKSACSQLETLHVRQQRTKPITFDSDSDNRSAIEEHFQFLLPAQQPDELGRLDHYRILGILGRGGMGIVFRAEDIRLKRPVALKVMLPSLARERSSKERFLREAQSAASIEHDNIISIYQVGEALGIPFIAMPLLSGQSLKTCLEQQGKLPQLEVAKIAYQIAMALAAAHSRQLIHRDIKPDNIWLEAATNRVKLLDFGLVRSASNDLSITGSGTVLGTPRYMSPEQAMGEAIDHRTDLFSLGSVLYHLLTGKPPFDGPTLGALLVNLVSKEPLPIQSLTPDIDADLATLIQQLMSKRPADRPATADELGRRLQPLLELLNAPATYSSSTPRDSMHTHQLDSIQNANHAVRLAKPNLKLSNRKLLTLGVVGCALLLLAVFVITIRDKDGVETVMRVASGTKTNIEPAPGSELNIREEPSSQVVADSDKSESVPDTASKAKDSPSQEQARLIVGWYTNEGGRTLTILPEKDSLRAVYDWANGAPRSVGEVRMKDDDYIFWQPKNQSPYEVTKDPSNKSIVALTVLKNVKFEKSVSYSDIIGKFKNSRNQIMTITDKDGQLHCSIDWGNNAPRTNGYIRVNANAQTMLVGYKWQDDLALNVVDKKLQSITLIDIPFIRQTSDE